MIVANVFHAGDGNLHPLVCYDGRIEGEAERAEELSGKILDACLDAGGSITGEHGVGVDKKKHMPKMFGEPDLDAFQRLRCAFDPAGLANPGKVMPTPRLCGEVPGPVPPASARGRRPGGAVLRPDDRRGGRGAHPRARRRRPGRAAASAAARSRGARRADGAVDSRPAGWTASLEHNVGDFTAVLEAGRAARRRAGARSPPQGQMLALDPPLGAADGATIGGDDRHRRLRPAAPPLRRRARPRRRHDRGAVATARSPSPAAR